MWLVHTGQSYLKWRLGMTGVPHDFGLRWMGWPWIKWRASALAFWRWMPQCPTLGPRPPLQFHRPGTNPRSAELHGREDSDLAIRLWMWWCRPQKHILLLLYIYINGYWNSEINRSRLRSSWIQHGSKDGPVTSQSGSTNWGMTAYCNLIPTYTSTTAETHGFEAPRLACRHQLSYAEDRTPGQWGVHARCIPKAGAPGSGQTSVCSILCHQWVQLWFNYVLTIYIYIYQL